MRFQISPQGHARPATCGAQWTRLQPQATRMQQPRLALAFRSLPPLPSGSPSLLVPSPLSLEAPTCGLGLLSSSTLLCDRGLNAEESHLSAPSPALLPDPQTLPSPLLGTPRPGVSRLSLTNTYSLNECQPSRPGARAKRFDGILDSPSSRPWSCSPCPLSPQRDPEHYRLSPSPQLLSWSPPS